MITKYGYDVVGVVLLIVVAGSLLSWFFIDAKVLKAVLIGFLLLLLLFTLAFFRDPERTIPPGTDLIVSPADGKVMSIREVRDEEFFQGGAVQVSIFMSPCNVHVNRFPITGTVTHFRHFPGEFLVAFDDKASTRNERTQIGVENGRTKVLFKQIAGFVARRIVANVRVGDRATAGERFGMIRFGSRVDVLMPTGVSIQVKVGDATLAGETVLARTS